MKKCFGLFLVLFMLSSCGAQSVSHDIAQNAINATTALEQSLPAQCATENIKNQINGIKSQIKTISTACETEKRVIEQEKLRWKWSFFALLAAIGLYVARKILI